MDSSVCYYVPKFFIIVFVTEKQRMILWKIEDVCEDIESVEALFAIRFFTGTLELVTNGDFKLGALDILKYKAGSSSDANDVVLDFPLEEHLDFLNL